MDGTREVRQCACNRCHRTFEVRGLGRGQQQRKYAPGCPVRAEELRKANRECSRKAHARQQESNPRRCHCGCGRKLPPRIWYHPDCQDKKAHRRREEVQRTHRHAHRCGLCEGQSWRRHPELGCIRCGAPYAPERLRKVEPNLGCAIAHCA